MSYNLRNIREISNDPLTKFTNQLSKKLAKFQTDQLQEQLESKEDVYSNAQDIDVVLKLHSFNSTKYFDFTTQYYPPFEPDGDKLKLWIRGYNLGNTLTDWTEFERTINLYGDPTLVDGLFDIGIHTGGVKSLALRFNRPTSDLENEEYADVTTTGLNINGLATGVSFFCRFKIYDLAQQGSKSRTLYVKADDTTTPSDAMMIKVTDDGRIQFLLKRAGTEYLSQTAASTITTNTLYDVWCTYSVSGNTRHIYVNNVDKTLTTPSSPTWPFSTTTAQIFRFDSNSGYVYADLYDMRVYREKVVSATEVGYMDTNKWTIANIPFGQVMISDYWATYATLGAGFTTTGYTTIGYDT